MHGGSAYSTDLPGVQVGIEDCEFTEQSALFGAGAHAASNRKKKGGAAMAAGKVIAVNRKARHDYFVLETFETGIELAGTEVKSIRAGGVNLKDSWCTIDDGELFVKGMHISPYDKGNVFNRDPFRVRKLLMHKREIMRLLGKVKQEGLTLVPLSLYFKKNHVKLEMGLCKGKQLHDKREDMARRDADREIRRAMKVRQR